VLRRELTIVLGARVTWAVSAIAAALIGHGFVLAVDIYSAGSRSARASLLMMRELDPLAGIVRPTLGGLYFAASLLAPIVAVRSVAAEKERRNFEALVIQTGSVSRVLVAKYVATLAGLSLFVAPAHLAMFAWRGVGGHLSFGETAAALAGHVLYLCAIGAIAVAAAAWTNSVAQAATLALVVVFASWAVDVSEGFSALAWLGRLVDWSVTTQIAPFERGIVRLGAIVWLVILTAGALGLAYVGARFDLARSRRVAFVVAIVSATLLALSGASRIRRAFDVTETQRVSLPPAAVRELRSLSMPIALEVWLDRDDSRRRQFEIDLLSKLRLARPDVDITMPLDARASPMEGAHAADDNYGRIVVRVGATSLETYSTSRQEVVRLIFAAAGRPLPDWSQPVYPGYPLVVDGARRTVLAFLAYVLFPGAFVLVGVLVTRSRRRATG
jgi:hypothetical protein